MVHELSSHKHEIGSVIAVVFLGILTGIMAPQKATGGWGSFAAEQFPFGTVANLLWVAATMQMEFILLSSRG